MSLCKRGGVWYYDFWFHGANYRKSTGTSNKVAARQIESALRVRLAKGESGIFDHTNVPTVREFGPQFEKSVEIQCLGEEGTIAAWKEGLRRLLEYAPLASRRLDLIDEQLIENFKENQLGLISRKGKPLKISSINRRLATLRRLVRIAYDRRIIDRPPKVRILPGDEKREFVLSYELEPVYLKLTTPDLHDLALIILDAGTRPGEAAELRWSNVIMKPALGARFGYIRIREYADQTLKSSFAIRNLSLTGRVAEMFAERLKSKDGEFVFPGRRSKNSPMCITSLDHQHALVREKLIAELKLSAEAAEEMTEQFVLHSLRHTACTRLGESGCDAFKIQKIAGHSSIVISQRYVHVAGGPGNQLREARRHEPNPAAGSGPGHPGGRGGRKGPPSFCEIRQGRRRRICINLLLSN
jgi:integrase